MDEAVRAAHVGDSRAAHKEVDVHGGPVRSRGAEDPEAPVVVRGRSHVPGGRGDRVAQELRRELDVCAGRDPADHAEGVVDAAVGPR